MRCKTPLFLRSTEQWVIKLSALRDRLIKENERITWVPEWAGRQRFGDWIREARDWVISRQRFWGTPLPIWICDKCGNVEVIGSVAELEQISGVKVNDLHIPYIDRVVWKCSRCDGTMKRVPDVLDVWIDSGAAPWASLDYPNREDLFNVLWPVDFITEGHDQTRGWFYAMLALSVPIFGTSPYRAVLMHGFTLDPQGRPMHKSLGNVIYPEEIVGEYGTDVLRTFLLKNTPWKDLPVSFKEIETTRRELEIVFNVYQFYSLYASLDNFVYEEEAVERNFSDLPEEDRWIISELEQTVDKVNKAVSTYHIHEYVRAVVRFVVDYISRRYLRMIRRRVWVEEQAWEKTAAYLTLHYVLKRLVILMAPFAPFISEYLYQEYLRRFDRSLTDSVHLERWVESNPHLIDKELSTKYELLWEIVSKVAALRQQAGLKMRQPLRELLISRGIHKRLTDRQRDLLRSLANVLDLKVAGEDLVVRRVTPKMDKIGPKWRSLAKAVTAAINENQETIASQIANQGYATISVAGTKVNIEREDVDIHEEPRDPYLMALIDGDKVFLNVAIDHELKLRGLFSDVLRRVQEMRKEMGLDVTEKIRVGIKSSSSIKEAIERRKDFFLEEVRAISVEYDFNEGRYDLVKNWEVDGEILTIGILRIENKNR